MNLLGSVGQLYMFVLLVLLFLGSGLALWRFVNFLMARGIQKQGKGENLISKGQNKATQSNNILNIKRGGLLMANNGWIKLAVFSLVGIIVSVAILGMTSTSNSNMQGMNMGNNQYQGMQQNGTNSMQGNMNMQGGMNANTQMGNMQGGMNVNTQMGNMQAQGNTNMNGWMDINQMLMMMRQNMYQMQMQLNQIQQQINPQMPQSGNMNNMPQNSGNMNNMPQNGGNMNNMPQGSGSSSMPMPQSGSMPASGGMGMMGGMM